MQLRDIPGYFPADQASSKVCSPREMPFPPTLRNLPASGC